MNFALRSGSEHRQLRFRDCQVEVVERLGQRPYIQYTEDVSKKGRKTKQKKVIQHNNTANPGRCPVRIFKMYMQLCPAKRPGDSFYLQPLKNPKKGCWFSIKPLGHNTLENMVKTMCKEAGIPGHKTNHSLWATAVTRLFNAGVEEQLIMERTGHASVDGVRSYKHTSDDQRAALSEIMNLSAPGSHLQQQQQGIGPQLSMQGISNCVININYGSK